MVGPLPPRAASGSKAAPGRRDVLCGVARSGAADVAPPSRPRDGRSPLGRANGRGARRHLRELALRLRDRREEASAIVAEETGKPVARSGRDRRGRRDGALRGGRGPPLYGRTTTASMPHRTVLTVRQPLGVAALIMSFNTPLPNVAWKAFPAVFCGNAAVVKPSDDAPASAWFFATLAHECGVPAGVLTSCQGSAPRPAPLSSSTPCRPCQLHRLRDDRALDQRGRGRRLARFALSSAANALVVCDDADLESGALGARIGLLERRPALRLRSRTSCSTASTTPSASGWPRGGPLAPQPVISEERVQRLADAVGRAVAEGGRVVCGGERFDRADGISLPPWSRVRRPTPRSHIPSFSGR